jgi:hypothetical protein
MCTLHLEFPRACRPSKPCVLSTPSESITSPLAFSDSSVGQPVARQRMPRSDTRLRFRSTIDFNFGQPSWKEWRHE